MVVASSLKISHHAARPYIEIRFLLPYSTESFLVDIVSSS